MFFAVVEVAGSSAGPVQSIFETELRISGVPLTAGLAEGGSCGFMHRLVTNCVGVLVDGYVQLIPPHDLKVVLRGTANDLNFVIAQIDSEFLECEIEVLRYVHRGIPLPSKPSFRIITSSSSLQAAKKSGVGPGSGSASADGDC